MHRQCSVMYRDGRKEERDLGRLIALHPLDCGTTDCAVLKTARLMSYLVRWLCITLKRTIPDCEDVAEWWVFLLAHSASVSVSGATPAALGASDLKLV